MWLGVDKRGAGICLMMTNDLNRSQILTVTGLSVFNTVDEFFCRRAPTVLQGL